jgi:predicted secreted protein
MYHRLPILLLCISIIVFVGVFADTCPDHIITLLDARLSIKQIQIKQFSDAVAEVKSKGASERVTTAEAILNVQASEVQEEYLQLCQALKACGVEPSGYANRAVCNSATVTNTLSGTTNIQLEHSLTVGKEYVITKSGNPTTGFDWMVEVDVDGTAVSVTKSYVQSSTPTGMVGVGGTYTFKIKGIKSGKARLVLTNKRPWEEDYLAREEHIFYISL